MKKMFINTFMVKVLSDSPLESLGVKNLYHLVGNNIVLKDFKSKSKEISPSQMNRELWAAGSEPGFFELENKN